MKRIAVALLCWWAWQTAAASEEPATSPPAGTPIFGETLDLGLQQVYVTVTGRGGRRVPDLERRDFRILDQGERQRIVTFENGDVPFTAVLLIDASRSMKGRRMTAALAGARAFVAGMKPLDEASVVVASDHLLRSSPFSSDPSLLDAELEGVTAGGGTSTHDYLFFALRRLESRQGRRVVVLLTHGRDVHSVLRMDQVREVARRSQAQIYWVRLAIEGSSPTFRVVSRPDPGPGQQHTSAVGWVDSWRGPATRQREARKLEKTVAESGGRILEVRSLARVEDAFTEVLAELRDQVALGYYPSEDSNDGSWRTLKVEVTRPGLKARTRGGYLDY